LFNINTSREEQRSVLAATNQEEVSMKHKCVVMMVWSIFFGVVGHAQIVSGSGTPNTVPLFTSGNTIGNSNIFQSPEGNIGIGVPPFSTFSVNNDSNSISSQGLEPYAIYGRLTNSTIDFSSAIRGESLATTGGGNGVIGLTSSSGGAGVFG